MANLIYRAQETAIQFSDTDGDYAISLSSLSTETGRISAQVDRGAGSRPTRYKWRASLQFASGLAVGQSANILLCESDGTYADGAIGTSDAAMTWYQAANMTTIGTVYVQAATTATSFVASGTFWIMERYFQVGVYNYGAALRALANINRIIVTPMPDEIQDYT